MPVVGTLLVLATIVGVVVAVGRRMKRDADELDGVNDMRSVALVRLVNVEDQALVRVVGRVAPMDPLLTAPYSGRPCVAYAVELRRIGDPKVIFEDMMAVGFYVEEDGARALVQPPCPIISLAARERGIGPPEELPPRFQAWLAEEHASDDWRKERRLTWTERRIEPGERAAVVGWARREVDGDGAEAAYRDAPSLIVLESADGAPLSISDDPRLLTDAK